MKKRFLGMVTAGILATVMLAGCGASASKVTAESLLQEVQSKCDAMKSLETHTTAEITLESDALGGTMDMTMDMTMQTTIEPVANYLKGNISIPGLGTAMDMENYTVVQDDQILSYTGIAGQWMVSKMAYDKDSVERINAAAEDLLKSKDSLKLADETQDVDGTEAYMISGSISGADVKNLLSSMESTLGGLTGDMENYTVVQDDQILSYTGIAGQWMVSKMAYDKDSVERINAAAEDLLKSKDSLKLADETQDVDGTEAYMISGSISGADVKNLLSSMESTLGGLTGDTEMNLDDITVDFTYAVSKADKMPLYMDMVFSGLGAGEGDEQVTFSKFNMKMEYTNYDTVEAITVPQDVVDSAIDVTDYLNDLQNETSSDTESETAA